MVRIAADSIAALMQNLLIVFKGAVMKEVDESMGQKTDRPIFSSGADTDAELSVGFPSLWTSRSSSPRPTFIGSFDLEARLYFVTEIFNIDFMDGRHRIIIA